MSDYRPSSIVFSLCSKLHEQPIAEAIRSDGTVVVIVADGRKLIFDKDDITRTLTEPALAPAAAGHQTHKSRKKESHAK